MKKLKTSLKNMLRVRKMRKSEILALGIILLSFLVGIYFYPKMPEKMAIHWNLKGEVNRYIPKFFRIISTFHCNSKNRSLDFCFMFTSLLFSGIWILD